MKKTILPIAFLFLPLVAYGQTLGKISNVNSLTTRLAGIGNIILYLLVSLAVIYIVWNVVHYFIRPDASDRKESGMNILWGIVGLFIIVSLWGIVNILVNTFYTDPNIPRDRFPNADFTNNNSDQYYPPPNSSINDEPYNWK